MNYKLTAGLDAGKSLKQLGRDRVIEKYLVLIRLCVSKGKFDLPNPMIEFMQQAELWIDGFIHTK